MIAVVMSVATNVFYIAYEPYMLVTSPGSNTIVPDGAGYLHRNVQVTYKESFVANMASLHH